ncbi:hypothetical protein PT974_11369 [Cladobotryum mycophilum]|uniref:Uncharacterized protein n=1 Tax=Cladobotryum mycophilum TaxID=491253 RepID=A0ABR0S617_9HYPO
MADAADTDPPASEQGSGSGSDSGSDSDPASPGFKERQRLKKIREQKAAKAAVAAKKKKANGPRLPRGKAKTRAADERRVKKIRARLGRTEAYQVHGN